MVPGLVGPIGPLTHRRRRRRGHSTRTSPASVVHPRHGRHGLGLTGTAVAVDTAGDYGEEDQTSDSAANTNDDVLVIVDPGFDLSTNRRALAATVAAVTAATARCAVEEVLLQTGAVVGREVVGGADQAAGRIVAGIGVVGVEKAAHHRSALEITAGALTAGAGKAAGITAFVTVILIII